MGDDEDCCDAEGATARASRFFVEGVATVDDRGQMVLPKAIRDRAGLNAGDKLAISVMERDGSVCCITLIRSEELAEMVKGMLGPMIDEVL
jgi:AbrB family looped-hinge helix DNA binding protein